MITNCPVCGKAFDVLWPQLWRYKRGQLYLCSWKHLRLFDEKGSEAMYTKVKKDGTPAKKCGPKAKAPVIETPEGEFVKGPVSPDELYEKFGEKGYTPLPKITNPVNYDGFLMDVIRSPETGARYEFSEGCLFVKIGAEEVVLEPSAWRKLIDEIPKAAEVLGVEL